MWCKQNICISLYNNELISKQLRYGIYGTTQFYLPFTHTHSSTNGTSHACIYSPATEHHCTMPVLNSRPTEARRLSWPGWLVCPAIPLLTRLMLSNYAKRNRHTIFLSPNIKANSKTSIINLIKTCSFLTRQQIPHCWCCSHGDHISLTIHLPWTILKLKQLASLNSNILTSKTTLYLAKTPLLLLLLLVVSMVMLMYRSGCMAASFLICSGHRSNQWQCSRQLIDDQVAADVRLDLRNVTRKILRHHNNTINHTHQPKPTYFCPFSTQWNMPLVWVWYGLLPWFQYIRKALGLSSIVSKRLMGRS